MQVSFYYLGEDVCQALERQGSGVFGSVPLELCHITHQIHWWDTQEENKTYPWVKTGNLFWGKSLCDDLETEHRDTGDTGVCVSQVHTNTHRCTYMHKPHTGAKLQMNSAEVEKHWKRTTLFYMPLHSRRFTVKYISWKHSNQTLDTRHQYPARPGSRLSRETGGLFDGSCGLMRGKIYNLRTLYSFETKHEL